MDIISEGHSEDTMGQDEGEETGVLLLPTTDTRFKSFEGKDKANKNEEDPLTTIRTIQRMKEIRYFGSETGPID